MHGSVLRRFDEPDETRHFEKGRLDLVTIGGLTVGRAAYEPGWKWSVHVAPIAGTALCAIEHVGLVISGHAVAAFEDGSLLDLAAGQLFHIPPVPHDSWVVGDAPYVSIHFLGAAHYAR